MVVPSDLPQEVKNFKRPSRNDRMSIVLPAITRESITRRLRERRKSSVNRVKRKSIEHVKVKLPDVTNVPSQTSDAVPSDPAVQPNTKWLSPDFVGLWETLTLNDTSLEGNNEEEKQTKRCARLLWARFRRLARILSHNTVWGKMICQKNDIDPDKFTQKTDEAAEAGYDPKMFRFEHRSYSGLTPTARRVLLKLPEERTVADLLILGDCIDRLKCFSKFDWQTRRSLCRVVYYDSYEEGRVIIKEGHISLALYFIMSGKVLVTKDVCDKVTGSCQTNVLGFMEEGASFGELAILHGQKRTASIRCKGSECEFLRVDKEDFDMYLRETYQKEWWYKKCVCDGMPCFENWTEADINILSRIKVYNSDSVIVSHRSKHEGHVHFIQGGTCKIVREVVSYVENSAFGRQNVLFPEQNVLDTIHQSQCRRRSKDEKMLGRRMAACRYRQERHFWQICTLKSGQYFNVGEDLRDTYIIAAERVVCLLVPKIQFLLNGNEKAIVRMRKELDAFIPTVEDVYKQYIRDFKWAKYTQSVIHEVFRDKPDSKMVRKNQRKLSDIHHRIIHDADEIVTCL